MDDPSGHPDAILWPRRARGVLEVQRFTPSPDLAHLVDYHWFVRWDADVPHDQQVVPHPRVHIASETGRLAVYGITTQRFHRRLHGRGHVFGVAFRPAAFRPMLGGSVSQLRNTVRPTVDVLGRDGRATAEAIRDHDEPTVMVQIAESWLRPLTPGPDATADEVSAWVTLAETDPSLCRVHHLAAAVNVTARTLQRRFTDYVGIGPKWVLQRSRILEVAANVHHRKRIDWAQLATTLGFSDQSHLTRAFTDVVGTPPDRYRRQTTRQLPTKPPHRART